MKAVAIVSGGMDSVTMAYLLKSQGHEVHAISFDYGQRHVKEVRYAAALADDGIARSWTLADLSAINHLLGGSSLTSIDVDVPDGHYAHETMKATVVPNRNMIMLAIAAGYAVSMEADFVSVGMHAGDHYIYPDCRPAFVQSMETALRYATEGFSRFPEPVNISLKQPDTPTGRALYAPFIFKNKSDIVSIGTDLGVPYDKTWSCYKGGRIHCGRCGTCVERKEAFRLAHVIDPTKYEDAEFEVVANQ